MFFLEVKGHSFFQILLDKKEKTMSDDQIYNVAPDFHGASSGPNSAQSSQSVPPFAGRPLPPWPGFAYQVPPRKSWFFRFLREMFFAFFGFVFSIMFFGFLLVLLLGGAIALLGNGSELESTKVTEKTLSGTDLSPYKVAILPIEGIIQGKEDGFVRRAIRQASEDPRISALILRVNSPGGTMSGSDYYYSLLKDLKTTRDIPIVVSMGSLAASGGYYISTVGDRIFAERSTLTGSIGVIVPLYNAAGLCEKIGVSSTAVTSGPMKGMGDFTKPMSPEEKEIWQALVDSSYEQFLGVVKEGRPAFGAPSADADGTDTEKTDAVDAEKVADTTDTPDTEEPAETAEAAPEQNGNADGNTVAASEDSVAPKSEPKSEPKTPVSDAALRKIADGRIYTAQQALELGLIDEIGFLDAAVKNAIQTVGASEDQVQVVRYKSSGTLAELLSSQDEEEIRMSDLPNMIQNALSPEVYYLCPRALPVCP